MDGKTTIVTEGKRGKTTLAWPTGPDCRAITTLPARAKLKKTKNQPYKVSFGVIPKNCWNFHFGDRVTKGFRVIGCNG
jgi:hypothetical protein